MDDFEKKGSSILNNDSWNGFLGINRSALFQTRAGVSSLYSEIYFLDDIPEEDAENLPDYVLSDTLQKDLDSSVAACMCELQKTKYFPSSTRTTTRMGAIPEGEREGVWVTGWEDNSIVSASGAPLYTTDMLEDAKAEGQFPFANALWLIVKDICDTGDFLSADWYYARIVYEYFSEYPLSADSAYLIGELFKELCLKQQFEGDLTDYYQNLHETKMRRQKGAASTKNKAEELRELGVKLFVDLVKKKGPRFFMAPAEYQADTLREAALEKWPDKFTRAGEPYGKAWFLRHVIEDRKLDIVEALEKAEPKKG